MSWGTEGPQGGDRALHTHSRGAEGRSISWGVPIYIWRCLGSFDATRIQAVAAARFGTEGIVREYERVIDRAAILRAS